MDHEEYVVARRSRLVEHAVDLGTAAQDAPALVDRVLEAERRTIRRAADPDPEVRDAVRAAVLGRPRRSRAGPIAAAALALALGLAAVVVVRQVDLEPPPIPRVPSTYALDGDGAAATLTAAGYRVVTREVELCETADQVIGTEPLPGSRAPEGSTVTVLVARPPGLSCLPGAEFRATVWQFLRWVAGLGQPPALSDEPTVVVIDDAGTRTTRLDATGHSRDDDLLGALREAVTRIAPTPSGFPELTVRNGVATPPCGDAVPDGYDSLLTIRFDLDTTATGTDACPLTGYLLSDGAVLDTVVLVVPANQ